MHIFFTGPSFGNGTVYHKLVLAKDAVKINGTFPRTPEYLEECQHPEALDPSKCLEVSLSATSQKDFLMAPQLLLPLSTLPRL